MKVFLKECWVFDYSLKFKTIVWDNSVFEPTFISKDLRMTVKDLILKLQEFDPEDSIVGVYECVDDNIEIKIKVVSPDDISLANKNHIILDNFTRVQ